MVTEKEIAGAIAGSSVAMDQIRVEDIVKSLDIQDIQSMAIEGGMAIVVAYITFLNAKAEDNNEEPLCSESKTKYSTDYVCIISLIKT